MDIGGAYKKVAQNDEDDSIKVLLKPPSIASIDLDQEYIDIVIQALEEDYDHKFYKNKPKISIPIKTQSSPCPTKIGPFNSGLPVLNISKCSATKDTSLNSSHKKKLYSSVVKYSPQRTQPKLSHYEHKSSDKTHVKNSKNKKRSNKKHKQKSYHVVNKTLNNKNLGVNTKTDGSSYINTNLNENISGSLPICDGLSDREANQKQSKQIHFVNPLFTGKTLGNMPPSYSDVTSTPVTSMLLHQQSKLSNFCKYNNNKHL